MKKSDIENRLIEIAKENPTGDYYVGSVGEDIRSLLRDMMGNRYPSDELDENLCDSDPLEPFTAVWEEWVKSVDNYAKTINATSPWLEVIKQKEFPSGLGLITDTLT